MAERKSGGAARVVRPVVFLLVVATVAILWWRYAHRAEGYAGGDVITTGTVEAVYSRLGFKVAGRLGEMPAVEGTVVRPGDLLGRLDRRDFEMQVRAARAALETARAGVELAVANRDRADRDLERAQALMRDAATTRQVLDAALAAAQGARAQLSGARAQVLQAETALAQAELQLSYTELRAVEPGQVSEQIHRPGEMVLVGTPIVALVGMDTVKVRAAVDETRVGAVRPGDRVEVKVYTFDRRVFQGVVSDVAPAGEFATRKDWGAQRRDIRTFTVTARVANPDGLLKDGMTAEVRILPGAAARGAAGAAK